MGIPGSGKTTLVQKRFRDYAHISLDILHSRNKESAEIEAALSERKSVIVDNTNTTRKTRQRYVEFARRFNVPIRAIYLKCPLDLATQRNATRFGESYVPEKAVRFFNRILEVPQIEEGFDSIEVLEVT